MKKRVLILVAALALLLSLSLTACGSDSNKTTPDEKDPTPAYSEDAQPSFTIAISNKETKEATFDSCGYMAKKDGAAGMTFYLTRGEYHIAVYRYDGGKAMGAPLLTTEYKNDIPENERNTVQVIYYPDAKKIEVTPIASDSE